MILNRYPSRTTPNQVYILDANVPIKMVLALLDGMQMADSTAVEIDAHELTEYCLSRGIAESWRLCPLLIEPDPSEDPESTRDSFRENAEQYAACYDRLVEIGLLESFEEAKPSPDFLVQFAGPVYTGLYSGAIRYFRRGFSIYLVSELDPDTAALVNDTIAEGNERMEEPPPEDPNPLGVSKQPDPL